ncbi:uncharacterized [Tachysurus ichikawai]
MLTEVSSFMDKIMSCQQVPLLLQTEELTRDNYYSDLAMYAMSHLLGVMSGTLQKPSAPWLDCTNRKQVFYTKGVEIFTPSICVKQQRIEEYGLGELTMPRQAVKLSVWPLTAGSRRSRLSCKRAGSEPRNGHLV